MKRIKLVQKSKGWASLQINEKEHKLDKMEALGSLFSAL